MYSYRVTLKCYPGSFWQRLYRAIVGRLGKQNFKSRYITYSTQTDTVSELNAISAAFYIAMCEGYEPVTVSNITLVHIH